MFSPVQHAGQGKPAAFSIEEKQLQITLGQKSFLVRLAVSRDFLPPHSSYNGTGFVLSLYYQKSVIEYKEAEMLSTHYKNWLSIEDARRCKRCEEMHGQIYEIEEVPIPEPPLHEKFRCYIARMEALTAGTATTKGKNGADWWIATYHQLPPYYISKAEARALGWKAWKGNLASVAPNKMIAKGIYRNDNGHLPESSGRIWFEADINYIAGRRGTERILYSNDGLIFVTWDHYHTFTEIVSMPSAGSES